MLLRGFRLHKRQTSRREARSLTDQNFLKKTTSKISEIRRAFFRYALREDTKLADLREICLRAQTFLLHRRGQITYAFVVAATIILLIFGVRFFVSRVDGNVGPGEVGALLSGLTSPILILWLIYSVRVQTQELREQKKARKYAVAVSVLQEGKELLNTILRSLLDGAKISMEERSVFDLSEAPFVFLDHFVTPKAPITLETNAPLHRPVAEFCTEYERIHDILVEIDPTRKTIFLLDESAYGSIYRILKSTSA